MSDFGTFSKRMGIRAEKLGENVGKIVRKAALTADRELVMRTPVDTGRARANWLVSVGATTSEDADYIPAGSQPANEAKSTQQALDQGNHEIAKYKVGAGPIYIQNGLPYIQRLDEGSSPQAPSGMTEHAVHAAREVFRKAKVL